MYIPFQEIATKLGLKSEDTLLIASDISKLAYNALKNKEKFDGNALIESFIQVVNNGTLLLPGYIDDFSTGDTFDKLKSPPEVGALSNLAFERTDFKRSNDPLHSFFAIGKDADNVAQIMDDSTFGLHSVFGYLKNVKAKMLLIDVDLEHGFTFAHFVEEQEKVSYRKFVHLNYNYVNESGQVEGRTMKVYSKKKGVVNTLNKFESILMEKGAMEKTEINKCVFRVVELDKAYEILSEDIKMNKAENLYSFDVKNFIRSTAKSILKK